ncbi:MAG TPA: Qat anti-phage system ATPase QatA [Candidatus Udaeobacter sp.]|jgi:hypothetical protein
MFISDQETEVDLLYYEAIARTLIKLVSESGDKPLTIGVHGDWGAGKSSILAMIEKAFSGDKDILCLRFNGWQFQGFDDAKAALIETIITKLRDERRTVGKVCEKAKELLKRVDYLKLAKLGAQVGFTVLTGMPHPDHVRGAVDALRGLIGAAGEPVAVDAVKTAVEKADGLLKPPSADNLPEQMVAFEKEFRELIDEAKLKKLVVLIDDLDRCLPETAIDTLEAIRLFLFAPKTAFVVAADEAMIQYAVRKHFPDLPQTSGPLRYDQNYLEKLIQVPFRIPALGPIETQTYMVLVMAEAALGKEDVNFQKLMAKARENLVQPWASKLLDLSVVKSCFADGAVPDAVNHGALISVQIFRLLAEGTKGNPRQIKRFLNAMLLRNEIATQRGLGSQITIPKLGKMMLAEQFAPAFYEELTKAAFDAANGAPSELLELEADVRGSKAQPRDGTRKKSAAPADGLEWLKNPWVRMWAGIEPALGSEDLRPYLFITRDKKTILGAAIAGSFDSLVERLSGKAMAVASAEADVKKLTPDQALAVFKQVSLKVIEAGDFSKQPDGYFGLEALVKAHPGLQSEFVQFFEALPVDKLGAWVATAQPTFFTGQTRERFMAVRERWRQEGSDKVKAALTAFESAGTRSQRK